MQLGQRRKGSGRRRKKRKEKQGSFPVVNRGKSIDWAGSQRYDTYMDETTSREARDSGRMLVLSCGVASWEERERSKEGQKSSCSRPKVGEEKASPRARQEAESGRHDLLMRAVRGGGAQHALQKLLPARRRTGRDKSLIAASPSMPLLPVPSCSQSLV